MIRIWNSKKLARELKDGEISEQQKFIYYFILFFLITISSTGIFGKLFYYENLNTFDYASDIAMIVSFVIGTLLVFSANQAGDKVNFIERITCLTLPVTVQVIVVIVPLAFVAGFLQVFFAEMSGGSAATSSEPVATGPMEVVIGIVGLVYFYYRMIKSMRIASAGADWQSA